MARVQRRTAERPRTTAKPSSAEEYKLIGNFHAVCKTLLQDRYHDRLERPLVFWAMANDRRLPLAFLGRTVGDLVETPFDELAATPGIGQKKIGTLIKLLTRAIKDQAPHALDGGPDADGEPAASSRDGSAPADSTPRESPSRFGGSGGERLCGSGSIARRWGGWFPACNRCPR